MQTKQKCFRQECDRMTGNRKYCSRSCAVTVNNTVPKRKRLAASGELCSFISCSKVRRPYSDYCSGTCKNRHVASQIVERWLSGEYGAAVNKRGNLRQAIRHYLHDQANNQCTRCGWAEINKYSGKVPIQIDHIDGDWQNNAPSNLVVLCPNCHSLTATYMGLNMNVVRLRNGLVALSTRKR